MTIQETLADRHVAEENGDREAYLAGWNDYANGLGLFRRASTYGSKAEKRSHTVGWMDADEELGKAMELQFQRGNHPGAP